jgi:hypothetical protein
MIKMMVLYIFSCKNCLYNMLQILRNFLKNSLVLYVIYSIMDKIFVFFAKIFLNVLIINNLTPRIPVNGKRLTATSPRYVIINHIKERKLVRFRIFFEEVNVWRVKSVCY